MDIIKRFAVAPYTLNEYGYCWGNPEKYVDNDGQLPTIVIGAIIGGVVSGVGSVVSQVVSGKSLDEGVCQVKCVSSFLHLFTQFSAV